MYNPGTLQRGSSFLLTRKQHTRARELNRPARLVPHQPTNSPPKAWRAAGQGSGAVETFTLPHYEYGGAFVLRARFQLSARAACMQRAVWLKFSTPRCMHAQSKEVREREREPAIVLHYTWLYVVHLYT